MFSTLGAPGGLERRVHVYPVVFPHVPLCDCVCSGSLSHMCGACAVSGWLGEEEPRDSRAQRRDSGRQAACQGA